MLEFYTRLINWMKEQKGQDLVEYALIAGLIALVCVIAITAAGTSVSTIWVTIQNDLASAASAV